MGDPVNTAAQLHDELTATLYRLPLPAVRRKELTALRDAARDIADQLAHIGANYVVLAFDEDADPVEEARSIFEGLPTGTINPGSGLDALTAVSPLLRTLAGAGISVTSLRKTSEPENRFSQTLGDDFGVIGDVWKQLRADQAHQSSSIVVATKRQMPKIRMLANILLELGLFELTAVEVSQSSGGDTPWATEDSTQSADRLPDTHPYRVTFARMDETQHVKLFTGEWLNGYATLLISAHLNAMAIPHEIYTSVAYTHPAEILRDNSDFDVIVHAAGTVAIFECKSGKLTGKAISKVVEHASGLATTLKSTGVSTDVRHFLLYIGSGGTRQVVERATAGSTVHALTPDQLRGTINALFTEHVGGTPSTQAALKRNSTPIHKVTAAPKATPPPKGQPKAEQEGPKAKKSVDPRKAEVSKPTEPAITEVATREALRDVAKQVFGSKEFRVAMKAKSLEFPLPLTALKLILTELAPVLAGTDWFPALSMNLSWALVDTDFQLGRHETHGLCLGKRGEIENPVGDLTHEDLLTPEVIAKVLRRHSIMMGPVPMIDSLRWLTSERCPKLPADRSELVAACMTDTGAAPGSVTTLMRILAASGLAVALDGVFTLSEGFIDAEDAANVLRQHLYETLRQHQWPDASSAIDSLVGIASD